MRSLQLQTALLAYLDSAAALLAGELERGEEIPFELEQQGSRRSGPSLYCYRPLIEDFIAVRRAALEALPAYAELEPLLGAFDGLDRYLLAAGAEIARTSRAARVRMAVANLLCDVFSGQSDFQLHPDRVQQATARLEGASLAATSQATLVATLHGVTITSPELALTAGLRIAHPEAIEGLPPEAAEEGEQLVVVLSCDGEDPRGALEHGEAVMRELLRALRLFGDGRVTLGALAWSRIAAGRWTPLALGTGGRPHGMLIVTAEQEDELRAFCNLVSRRAPAENEIAWALRRFELGCERESPLEGLSDNLLALRALLEPEGPASGLLAGRLAALCAKPEERLAMTERTIRAIALEAEVIAGTAASRPGAFSIAAGLEANLRALLRDVICGHLDPDLPGLADELLLSVSEPAGPGEISAEQLPGDPGQSQEILNLFV